MTEKLSRETVLRIKQSGWGNKSEREALCDMALAWLDSREERPPSLVEQAMATAPAMLGAAVSDEHIRRIAREEFAQERQQTINAAVAKALLEFGKLAPAYWNRAHQRAAELEAGE